MVLDFKFQHQSVQADAGKKADDRHDRGAETEMQSTFKMKSRENNSRLG